VNLKSACFLLSLIYAGSAAAIGLGDISVRSYLGQPLHATVTLLGATAKTAADCFSLDASPGSIAPPLHAQFSIEKSGGLAVLHIRTPRSINDPIVQFVLAADCEGRLQRDYVVLLDPPVEVKTASVPVMPVTAASGEASGTATGKISSATGDEAPHAAVAPRTSRRATRANPAAPTIARPSAASRQPAPPARPTQPASAVAKPRLVISGKHGTEPDSAPPPHPDTDLPEQTLPSPDKQTVAELSDDNTALSRRIAHLEMQLAALRKRNAELDARRNAMLTRVVPPAPDKPAQWPLYLLAIGLLTGGGAFAVWLGRRHNRRVPDVTSWMQAASLPALAGATPTPEAEPQRLPEVAPPAIDESTQVSDDVVDQAEVYLAHGHDELAVHLLQEHLREAPTESPVPWFLLLDLLHRAGDTDGYAAARVECSRYFNVNLGSHPFSQDIETGKGLEAYPHLLEQLVQKWNTPEIDTFFNDLIYDHRGGTRIGFEPGAYRDILLLRSIAQDALPLAA
jgi:Tfp pilus assembly protein FimV